MEIYLRIRRIACVCIALLIPCGVYADTVLQSDNINVDTTWTFANSPYRIQGNISVNDKGGKLTIEPGVRVQFDGDYKIIINGTLIAKGTTDNKITFTAPGDTIIGASLEFSASAVDATFNQNGYVNGSILEYVVVEKIGAAANGAVVISGAHPYIHNSLFVNNGASGVFASDIDGLLRVEGNTFESNSGQNGAGMFITSNPSAQLFLRENKFLNNTAMVSGGGLNVTLANAGMLTLTGNTIDGNNAGFKGGGVYLAGPGGASVGTAVLDGNKITNNEAVDSSGGLLAEALTLQMNAQTVSGNKAIKGGGLGLFDTNATINTSMLSNNTAISSNGGGLVLYGGVSNITDTVFASNRAPGYHGGAIDMHKQTLSPIMNIDHSVFGDNMAKDYGAAISFTDGTAEVINSAIVLNRIASALGIYKNVTLQGNTIAYNLGDSNTFYGSAVGVKAGAVVKISRNNFIGNRSFDIFSEVAGVLDAMSNWWNGVNPTTRVKVADVATESIDVSSPAPANISSAPISPPPDLTAVATQTSIQLQWQNNPEINRVTGYKVYWGSKPSPDFTNQVDVPLSVLSYEIPGLDKGNHYVAVTAYDTGFASPTPTELSTPVNENQTRGHESWYSGKKVVLAESDLIVNAVVGSAFCVNGQCKTGELMWHEITVTNSIGPSDALAKITLKDTIPAGMLLATTLPTGCVAAGNEVICTLEPIELNASAIVKIPMTVTEPGSKIISNLIEISSPDDPDPTNTNNQATLNVLVNPMDLAVSWDSSPLLAAIGKPTTFTVTTKNIGRAAMQQAAALTVVLPTDVTVDTLADGCSVSANILTCPLAAMAANAEVATQFSVTAPTLGDRTFSAHAASASGVDANLANNNGAIKITFAKEADLSVTLTYGGIVAAQQERYTVEVKNNGPETANNIKLTVTAPAGFVANPDQQKCVTTDNVMTCALGVLLAGEKFSMEIIASMPGSGDFKLVAQVQSDQVDATTANNEAVVTRTKPGTGTKKKGGGAAGMEWFALFFVMLVARRFYPGEKASIR